MRFEKFNVYLGEKLYCARVVRRMTQNDMVKLISAKMKENGGKKGISQQSYAYYEKGERSIPWDVFTYACEILSLDRNTLFNEACDYIKIKD